MEKTKSVLEDLVFKMFGNTKDADDLLSSIMALSEEIVGSYGKKDSHEGKVKQYCNLTVLGDSCDSLKEVLGVIKTWPEKFTGCPTKEVVIARMESILVHMIDIVSLNLTIEESFKTGFKTKFAEEALVSFRNTTINKTIPDIYKVIDVDAERLETCIVFLLTKDKVSRQIAIIAAHVLTVYYNYLHEVGFQIFADSVLDLGDKVCKFDAKEYTCSS